MSQDGLRRGLPQQRTHGGQQAFLIRKALDGRTQLIGVRITLPAGRPVRIQQLAQQIRHRADRFVAIDPDPAPALQVAALALGGSALLLGRD
ncbi:hypothetical protein ACFXPI_05655 [Streptomyces sp. NPDC059104]|uniref:hypothetical protein n=1 Tax=Streptomyces sp. NPDC059104 TaxID=3346729 RepID=UPI00369C5726